jgi:hypothetical protein
VPAQPPGTQDPAPTPPAPPGAPPAPPPAEPAPITFADSKALDARLDRARNNARSKLLKDAGFESEEQFAAFKQAADEQAKAAEEAKRAEMSEIERYKNDLEAANQATAEEKAKAEAATREAEDMRLELHLRQECAKRGIANTDYAIFLIDQKLGELGDDEDLDEGKFLDDLVADETQKGALGFSAPPPQEGVATTVAPQDGPPPPPDGPEGEKSALDMTPDELRAEASKHGFNLP